MRICVKKYVMPVVVSIGLLIPIRSTAQEPGLRDVRGPVPYPLDPLYVIALWLIMAAGLLVICRLGWRVYRHRRAFVPRKPVLPPWEVALRRLEELRDKKYLEYAKFDQYYLELSDILRRYMEVHFGVRAPEMTTEEFLVSIRENATVSDEHKALLGRFMQQADAVKFAKAAPTVQEAEQSWELARRFIMQSYEDEENGT